MPRMAIRMRLNMSDPISRPKPGISPKTINDDWSRLSQKDFETKERAFRDELRNGGVSRGWY